MPIKPIDLQTLFSQLNQVAKQQAAEKEGAALHASLHGAVVKRMEDEAAKAVQRPKDDQESTKSVDDKSGSRRGGQGPGKRRPGEDEDDAEAETIKDPDLGGHVDITG